MRTARGEITLGNTTLLIISRTTAVALTLDDSPCIPPFSIEEGTAFKLGCIGSDDVRSGSSLPKPVLLREVCGFAAVGITIVPNDTSDTVGGLVELKW
jgi:hypothetical protein